MPFSCRKRETVFKNLVAITCLVLFLAPLNSMAQQTATVAEPLIWNAKIEEDKSSPSNGIPFLTLDQNEIQVEGTSTIQFSQISGQFSEKVIQATFNSKDMPIKEDGKFEIHFGFPLESKSFTITVIDTRQKVFRAKYKIIPLNLDEKSLKPAVPVKRFRYSAGAGVTLLSFRQKNLVPFSQMAATIKASGTYRLVPDKYDLGLSAFYNLVPFASTSPAGYKIQYLGINGRIGTGLIKAPSPLRVNLNAGFYYNTSVSDVGFTNMYGPQLYPEMIYVFNNGNSILVYGKFSPALSNSLSISLSNNREVAMGSHFSFKLNDKHRLSVGIDISQLNLLVDKSTDWASTNTYSLSAGLAF